MPVVAASNDIGARAVEVQALVGDDRGSDAIQRLMDFVRDFSDDKELIPEVTILSANYKRVEKAERMGTLAFDEVERHRTRILFRVFQILDQVQTRPKLPPPA